MSARETVGKTFLVAGVLCVVCSILVSVAAVGLKPIQQKNKALDKKKNILAAAGLLKDGSDIEAVFAEKIRVKAVDLSTGQYAEIDADAYDQRKAAKDPASANEIPSKKDIARIKRFAKIASVYEVVDANGGLEQIILPMHGKGLWSTMYGFMAIKSDLKTIVGLGFYEHAETPGLGGEIDNPKWKGLWPGKKLYDDSGKLAIKVLKGLGDPNSANAIHEIDGLSGATLTTNGVDALVRFWLGADGFEKYLLNLKQKGNANG